MRGTLKDHLAGLRLGQVVEVGDYIPILTSYGDEGEYPESLSFQGGQWIADRLCCTSGNCAHNSHEKVARASISRAEALGMLRAHLAAEEANQRGREAEIAWLDQAISACDRD